MGQDDGSQFTDLNALNSDSEINAKREKLP
jgi:hypothetical protein